MSAAREGGYFMVPNDVIVKHGRTLGIYGLSVYMALAKHADRDGIAYPSMAGIAKLLGISRPTVALNIRLLVGLRLVRVVSKGGHGRSTVYQLVAPFYGRHGQPGLHEMVKPVDTKKTQEEETTRARAPPTERPDTVLDFPPLLQD